MRALLLIVTVLAISLTSLGQDSAKAYRLWGVRFDHRCISVSDDQLRPAVEEWAKVSGIVYCGLETPKDADVRMIVVSPWDGGSTVLAYAGPCRMKTEEIIDQSCIYVPRNHDLFHWVLVHEMGHALGLDHSCEFALPQAGITFNCNGAASEITDDIMAPAGGFRFDDAAAGMVALYGPRIVLYQSNRYFMAVARD